MSAESTAAQEVADQRRFRAYTGNVLGLATVIANNVDIDRLDGRMRDPDSKELMTQAISHALRLDLENPFQKDPEDIVAQVEAAAYAYDLEIPEAEIDRIIAAAPSWPKGPMSFLGVRINLADEIQGEFVANMEILRRLGAELEIPGTVWMELPDALRPFRRSRAVATGLEWFACDLSSHAVRRSIADARSTSSMGIELLALLWQFPQLLKALSMGELPGMAMAGLRYAIAKGQFGTFIPTIGPDRTRTSGIVVEGLNIGNRNPNFTVPEFLPITPRVAALAPE